MKLWEVTNGFIGESYVKCFVIAESENKAINIAKENYKNESKGYGERYCTNLKAECICESVNEEWCSSIRDC